MQWSGPGSNSREQILVQKWLTRGGAGQHAANVSMVVYRGLGYPGKNFRGVAVSWAVYPADIQTEFGNDVVLTDDTDGKVEDIAFPAGIIDTNIYYTDAPWQRVLVPVVIWGSVDFVHCTGAAAIDQTLLTLTDITNNGKCANFGKPEFASRRRLSGNGTMAAGAFSMAADQAPGIDWLNAENASCFDTLAATGLGAGSGGVPTAAQGIMGIVKPGVADTSAIADYAPFLSASPIRRPAFITCMQTAVGRV